MSKTNLYIIWVMLFIALGASIYTRVSINTTDIDYKSLTYKGKKKK